MLLFKTIAGSRLHGLDSNLSDFDYVEVHTELPQSKHGYKTLEQTVENGADVTKVTLSRFLELASAGSHQMLDAIYSPIPEVDHISALRAGFVGGSNIINRLRGTIVELLGKGEPKKLRHAARITVNLEEFLDKGYYNPVLSDESKNFINNVSQQNRIGKVYSALNLYSRTEIHVKKRFK